MTQSDRRHSRRSRGRVPAVLALVLVLVLVAGAVAAWRLDLPGRWQAGEPAPSGQPATVPGPPALALAVPPVAAPVAVPLEPGRLRPAALRRAVAGLLTDPRTGPRLGLAVAALGDPAAGGPAYATGPRVVVPASTMKLVTALTALEVLGPEHRFATSVLARGPRLTLVGGGDPLLASAPRAWVGDYPARADLVTLARRTAAALAREGRTRVRLGYDASLFTGPAASPSWEEDYLPDDVVSPVSALWADEGRVTPGLSERSPDPAREAAVVFAAALHGRGVEVRGTPRATPPPAGSRPLAAVRGAELVEVVQHVLEASDNEAAEVLARHVALAEGEPGSFLGVGVALPGVLSRLGVGTDGVLVRDGSGLSRANRLPLTTLLEVLGVAAQDPALSGVLAGLPVAGWSGSLGYRFTVDAAAGLGRVRAKTGTLTGVHGLAGVVTTADGAVLAFAAVADRVAVEDTLFARDRLDQLAAALARCSCSR